MVYNTLDYKIQANTLELESDLTEMQANICELYNRINDIARALSYDYATRAETSDMIDNLESKMPFQIFDTNFEVEGIPMKIMANPDYPDRLYIIPTNPEKTIKLVFENESIDSWYKKFVESLEL